MQLDIAGLIALRANLLTALEVVEFAICKFHSVVALREALELVLARFRERD